MAVMRPCLWFDANAEEAVAHYMDIFPDSEITSTTYYGKDGPGPKGSVLVIEFTLRGQPLMALNGGPAFKFTPAVSLSVSCDDQAEIDRLWDGLGDGGRHDQCGWVTDRFGLSWQVVPAGLTKMMTDPDRLRVDRVMHALLGMVKLDKAALERAFEG